jgi:O-antigen/teichoic acid export membrane protein
MGGAGESALYIRELLLVVVGVVALRLAGGLVWDGVAAFPRAKWVCLLKDVRPLWLDFAMESTFQRLQVLAAAELGGVDAAGVFMQAKRLAMVPHQILQPVTARLALNWFSRDTTGAARRARCFRLNAIVAVPLGCAVLAAWLFADPVIPWVFGDNWAGVAPVLVALSGNILFPSLFSSHKMLLTAESRLRPVLLARALQLVSVAAPFTLAPSMGAGGVGLATCVSLGWLGAFLVTSAVLSRAASPEGKA